eukprot:30672-Pelagococcus_subviridis.AAC.7
MPARRGTSPSSATSRGRQSLNRGATTQTARRGRVAAEDDARLGRDRAARAVRKPGRMRAVRHAREGGGGVVAERPRRDSRGARARRLSLTLEREDADFSPRPRAPRSPPPRPSPALAHLTSRTRSLSLFHRTHAGVLPQRRRRGEAVLLLLLLLLPHRARGVDRHGTESHRVVAQARAALVAQMAVRREQRARVPERQREQLGARVQHLRRPRARRSPGARSTRGGAMRPPRRIPPDAVARGRHRRRPRRVRRRGDPRRAPRRDDPEPLRVAVRERRGHRAVLQHAVDVIDAAERVGRRVRRAKRTAPSRVCRRAED